MRRGDDVRLIERFEGDQMPEFVGQCTQCNHAATACRGQSDD
jgi:hypothetical protein